MLHTTLPDASIMDTDCNLESANDSMVNMSEVGSGNTNPLFYGEIIYTNDADFVAI